MCTIRSRLKCNVSHTPMSAVVLYVLGQKTETGDQKLTENCSAVSCKSALGSAAGMQTSFSIEAISWMRPCSTLQWRVSTGSQRCTAPKRLYRRSESHVAAFTGERGDGNSIDGFPYISIISSKLPVLDRLTTSIAPRSAAKAATATTSCPQDTTLSWGSLPKGGEAPSNLTASESGTVRDCVRMHEVYSTSVRSEVPIDK